MHNGHIRRQPLHIDVIHFSLMIGHVQNTLNDQIITSPTIATSQKAPLVKAWAKLLWIQNDLFTKWHVKDGHEYEGQMTDLSPESMKLTEADMKDEDGNKMLCPFSSMVNSSRASSMTSRSSRSIKSGYIYKGYGIGSINSIVDPMAVGESI